MEYVNTAASREMDEKSLISLFIARLSILASVFLYAGSIYYAHTLYLSAEQWVWGFNEASMSGIKLLFIAVVIALPAYLLPLKIDRPSSLIIYFLFIFVYVPALVIGVGNRSDSLEIYGNIFIAFCAGFLFICISGGIVNEVSKYLIQRSPSRGEKSIPTSVSMLLFLVAWMFLCLVLYYKFHDKMSLVGLGDIYEQRERGLATSRLIGYAQVYFAYVFTPVVMVIGLHKRNLVLILLAIFGFLTMFLITAERTVFLLPFAIVGLYVLIKLNLTGPKSITSIFIFSAFCIYVIVEFYPVSGLANSLGFYYLTRLVGYPGLFVTQYYDLFSVDGFTYWSHVSGVGAFIEAPSSYQFDDKWPMLGKILAERVLNVESNSNASLFATDGVAALGAPGIFLLSVFLGLWLAILDWVAFRWQPSFALPVLFPLAFALTNASFFTVLLSFGGVFWTLYFGLAARRQPAPETTTT